MQTNITKNRPLLKTIFFPRKRTTTCAWEEKKNKLTWACFCCTILNRISNTIRTAICRWRIITSSFLLTRSATYIASTPSTKNSINRNSNKTYIVYMSKTNERSCRIFGKLSRIPPLFISGGKTSITFFSIGQILPKKILWDKSIHFVCFPKQNKLTLSVSHDFSPFLSKI